MKKRGILFSLPVLIFLPSLINVTVYYGIQNRMKIKISGQTVPAFFAPSFSFHNPDFEWPGKFRFDSGDLEVRYDIFSFFEGRCLRLSLSSQNAVIELKGKWAERQKPGRIRMDEFSAQIGIRPDGSELCQVKSVTAKSPDFHFEIKESA